MIMEYFLYAKSEENGKVTENYNNDRNDQYFYQDGKIVKKPEPLSNSMMILVFILYLVFGIYAAKLSWYSNSKAGWSQGYKVLFAILAFMFPFTYITAHILFKIDLLSRIKGKSMSY